MWRQQKREELEDLDKLDQEIMENFDEFCETLKKNFPDCQVDIVIYTFAVDVLKNNPYIDNVIMIDILYITRPQTILKMQSTLKRLYNIKYLRT